MIKQVVLYHFFFSALFMAGSLLWAAPYQTLSLLIGCAAIGLNLTLILWSWSRIFQKKSVALAVGVIVFKYAILGVIIYLVTSSPDLDSASFSIGLSTLVPTIIVFALKNYKKNS